MNTRIISLGAVSLLLGACGSSVPPQKLVDARTAYAEAEKGVAAEFAPARLAEAKDALDQAERAFADDEEGEAAAVAAYIAIRRAEIATARGSEKKHKEQLKKLEKGYAELEKKRLSLTQEQLADVNRRLENAKKELGQEREARKAAEARLTAAVASLKEMAAVKEEARGVVITLSGSVLFATGKHELLPIAKEKLDEVAKALIESGYGSILVEGHTDSMGSDSANEALSLKRAEAVRTHLVSQGIDKAKIQAKGLGESRPVASNDTPDGRANNRRVEIVVGGS